MPHVYVSNIIKILFEQFISLSCYYSYYPNDSLSPWCVSVHSYEQYDTYYTSQLPC